MEFGQNGSKDIYLGIKKKKLTEFHVLLFETSQ